MCRLSFSSMLAILVLLIAPGESAEHHVDFLVTSDRYNVTDESQHYVIRITDPASIAIARTEVNRTDDIYLIRGWEHQPCFRCLESGLVFSCRSNIGELWRNVY